MDCRLPGSSVHGIFQARVLEWGAIAFSGPAWLVPFFSEILKNIFIYLFMTVLGLCFCTAFL